MLPIPPPYSVLDDGFGPTAERTPAPEPEIPAEDHRRLYRTMALARALEQRLMTLQRQGRITFSLTSTGEEAAQLGSAYALRKEDWIFPSYREPGAALLRGLPLTAFVNQMFGNAMDLCRGRQMPCHYAFRPANFMSISSPVGTQIPQAVGAAWAARFLKHDAVVLTYFGEGATSEGDFHVGMNFAMVSRAPVVFFCRNNGFAISTRFEQQTASESIAIKALAYGMPGVQTDGNDILAVYHATREAVARARSGQGPTLIEAITYRMGAHSSSDDPTQYRGIEELKQWEQRDPAMRYQRWLEAKSILKSGEAERLQREAREEVNRAVAECERHPPPAPETLFDDVYARIPPHLARQREELLEEIEGPKG